MEQLKLADYIRPGDIILVGQAAAEPPNLVRQLIAASTVLDDLTALCGYAQSTAWEELLESRSLKIKTYAGHGPFRKLSDAGMLDILPIHLSSLEPAIRNKKFPIDVVLLQVGPPDADGFYNLGATVDYAMSAIDLARTVIVEVNTQMPKTRAKRRLHSSRVTASIFTDTPLPNSPASSPSPLQREVASRVAALVPSGATIQLGIGALADAIAFELRGRKNLRVRSGLVGEWLVDLYDAGALADEPASCVTGMALGGPRLYSFIEDSDLVQMAPLTELLDPAAVATAPPYFSINSAVEVDLFGQVGSEVINGKYVGAVGGQVDFLRAAKGSEGGVAIVAMPSVSSNGESRIVNELSGPVTSLKSDVDILVTEWGVADISTASLAERADRIVDIAAPDFRHELRKNRPPWV